jgi:two-component system chemotaxis response regulator CheB
MAGPFDIVVVGGSAGSLSMVLQILPHLKADMPVAIVLVFHRKSSEDTTLIELLAHRTEFEVKEVDEKDPIRPNVIYVAPADYHVLIEKDHTLSLDVSEKVNFCRPSIDVTFESAADIYGASLMCILLSGANADGVQGLKTAREKGGFIVVQDPASAEVSYMPQQATEQLPVDLLLHDDNIDVLMDCLRFSNG